MSRRKNRRRRAARRERTATPRSPVESHATAGEGAATWLRRLTILATARLRTGDRPFAGLVWGPLVTLCAQSERRPAELRLRTETEVLARVEKEREN